MKFKTIAAVVIFTTNITLANFEYSDFSSVAGLDIGWDAFRLDNKIRLTTSAEHQKGSVFYQTKQFVQSGFETTFQFKITDLVNTGADGIWFHIKNPEISPYKALWVELDTWDNIEWNDPSGNHVGIFLVNDENDDFHHDNCIGSTSLIPDLSDGGIHTIKINYTLGAISVFIDDMISPVLTTSINLFDSINLDNGKASVGITAATGSVYEIHDLLNWSFTEIPEFTTPPIADADGPYVIFVGDTLTLDANNSFETDAGSQAIFDVNYTYLQSLGLLVNHTYNIHLKVTDSEGQSDVNDSTLTIVPKPALWVAVDIKPGSCPNPLNVKSSGVLPVAILGTADVNVIDIDPASIQLAGVGAIRSSIEDVGIAPMGYK